MNHVFSEIGPEWYVDGLPVSELKRRYEAHEGLVASVKELMHTDDVGILMFGRAVDALKAATAPELQPGEATTILNSMECLRKPLSDVRKNNGELK
jgi:hypothetical protein